MRAPTHAELEAFAFGKLTPPEVAEMAARLEQFPDALVELQTISAGSDSLLDTIRQAIPVRRYAAEPELQQALRQVTGMCSADETIDVASRPDATLAPAVEPVAIDAPRQIRDYRLQDKLGEGGMGAVYRAVHERLEKSVALKILPAARMKDAQVVARFHREMKAVGRLDHPNIIRATDAGEEQGTHFLVMEYVEGEDVSRLVDRRGPLSVADACEIVRQAAVGLQHAHEHGLVHRDIKPANMLLTRRGVVKLLDMGLARLHDDGPIAAGGELTTDGQMMGTVDYMAPEQAVDTRSADIRADIYSLGCSLYKLLTGKAPFAGEGFQSAVQKLMAHTMTAPPSLAGLRPDLPPALSPIVERMMAKDRNARFSSPGELAEALAPFCAGADLTAAINNRSVGDRASAIGGATSAVSLLAPVPDAAPRASSRIPPRRRSVLLAVAASLPFIALGVWLIVKDKDGNEIARLRLPKKASVLREVDGKVTPLAPVADAPAEAETEPKAAAVHAASKDRQQDARDPARRAAEYALSVGGTVTVREGDAERPIPLAADLPKAAFELTGVDFRGNKKVTDAGLKVFKQCGDLVVLVLAYTNVGDEGLANFANCHDLKHLHLDGLPMTDAGLAAFKDCSKLEHLSLNYNGQIGDEGLAHFAHCPNLKGLGLIGVTLTDAGLANFSECRDLRVVSLQYCQIGDAGMAHLQACKNIEILWCDSTRVTAAGLGMLSDCSNLWQLWTSGPSATDETVRRVKGCQSLADLWLVNGAVSDASLENLAGLSKLQGLNLTASRISLRGRDALKAALPSCNVLWSEGNRNLAEAVFAVGGTVEVAAPGDESLQTVATAADLPEDYFQVRRVSLVGVDKPLVDLWPLLKELRWPELDRVESLDLSGVPGLNYGVLNGMPVLEELVLANAGLTDDSLPQLLELSTVRRLVLDGNVITGARLAELNQFSDLSLGCASLQDLNARNLSKLTSVKRLSLAGSGLTDAGLQHLTGLTDLQFLDLRGAKVTATGVDDLAGSLPGCRIEWDGKQDP